MICIQNHGKIFDAEITYVTKANNLNIHIVNEQTVSLTFDFLNLYDGFVIEVYHNCIPDDIIIIGTLIGAKNISKHIQDLFGQTVDKILFPMNYLIEHKNIFLKLIGAIIIFPTLIVIIVAGVIAAFLSVFASFNDRTPRKFLNWD